MKLIKAIKNIFKRKHASSDGEVVEHHIMTSSNVEPKLDINLNKDFDAQNFKHDETVQNVDKRYVNIDGIEHDEVIKGLIDLHSVICKTRESLQHHEHFDKEDVSKCLDNEIKMKCDTIIQLNSLLGKHLINLDSDWSTNVLKMMSNIYNAYDANIDFFRSKLALEESFDSSGNIDVTIHVEKINELLNSLFIKSDFQIWSEPTKIQIMDLIKKCKECPIFVTFDNISHNKKNEYDLKFHTKNQFLNSYPRVNDCVSVCFDVLDYKYFGTVIHDWFESCVYIVNTNLLKKVIGCPFYRRLDATNPQPFNIESSSDTSFDTSSDDSNSSSSTSFVKLEYDEVIKLIDKLNKRLSGICIQTDFQIMLKSTRKEFTKSLKSCKGHVIIVTFDNVKHPYVLNAYDLKFHTEEQFFKLFPQVNDLKSLCFSDLNNLRYVNTVLHDWFDCGVFIVCPIRLKGEIGCDINVRLNTNNVTVNNTNNVQGSINKCLDVLNTNSSSMESDEISNTKSSSVENDNSEQSIIINNKSKSYVTSSDDSY